MCLACILKSQHSGILPGQKRYREHFGSGVKYIYCKIYVLRKSAVESTLDLAGSEMCFRACGAASSGGRVSGTHSQERSL